MAEDFWELSPMITNQFVTTMIQIGDKIKTVEMEGCRDLARAAKLLLCEEGDYSFRKL